MTPRSRKIRRRKQKRTFKFFLTLLVIVGAMGFYVYLRSQVTSAPKLEFGNVPVSPSTNGIQWWNIDYAYRQSISIGTDTKRFVKFSLDHASMVVKNQALASADDLKVVAQVDKFGEEQQIDIQKINTIDTQITFDTDKYPTASYYLYYGNKNAQKSKVLGSKTVIPAETSSTELAATEKTLVSATIPRLWVLRYKAGTTLNLSLSMDPVIISEGAQYYYVVKGENELNPIAKSINPGDITIDLGAIKTGNQSLSLVVQTKDKVYRSNEVSFIVSSPMYVAWSIDWEGKDVPDRLISQIDTIAKQYSMPLTEFFNPRIFIAPDVPEYRRGQLTNWVLQRAKQNGDEIAMHMHMYYDMVNAAGLEAARSPRWGSGVDGYDVLTTDYNYADFTKMLKWALAQFDAHGLPRPAGYRTGGWFANLDTLKALNDYGFKYDSSGRDAYDFGTQKQKGFWDLSPTTNPYQPSSSNQNTTTPAPQLNLWEMPNNGLDSYWHTAEELIQRFDTNYAANEILNQPRLVTYLSHPDWFDQDRPRIEALFSKVDQFSFAKDKGPVVYTTLSNALREWE